MRELGNPNSILADATCETEGCARPNILEGSTVPVVRAASAHENFYEGHQVLVRYYGPLKEESAESQQKL